MKRVIFGAVITGIFLVSCSSTNQQDQLATQVATALIATSAAQSAIDTAVAATMTSAQDTQGADTSGGNAPVLMTATPGKNTTNVNPTATAQVIVPVETATTEAQMVVATETVAIPPTETVAIPPTETVAIPPTETVAIPPTETVVNQTTTPVITIVIKPTSTLSLVIPTLKPLTPIFQTIQPTIILP